MRTTSHAAVPTRRPPARRAARTRSLAAERVRLALEDRDAVERLSRTFRALGDPTRSRMVLALSLAEICVSDLAAALGASVSATSHQLRILRDLGMVRVRRAGKSQLYVLNEQALGFCAPRVCQAWRAMLAHEAPARGRARGEAR